MDIDYRNRFIYKYAYIYVYVYIDDKIYIDIDEKPNKGMDRYHQSYVTLFHIK